MSDLLSRFVVRMMPDARQLLTSTIRITIGSVTLYASTWIVAEPYHGLTRSIGMLFVAFGVFPLITRPEGVVTDAIADLLTKPEAREKAKLWWMLQTKFAGDQQAMDRALRNSGDRS